MKFSVVHVDGRYWAVEDENNKIVACCGTNSWAWREADRLNSETISKSEETAEWSFNQESKSL